METKWKKPTYEYDRIFILIIYWNVVECNEICDCNKYIHRFSFEFWHEPKIYQLYKLNI